MGVIFSTVRKKKSTIETLEKLENDIKEIEENRTNAQRKYKKITKLLLVYSVGLYILCGIVFYFQFTSSLKGKLLYLVPLAISPLLLYIIKRIISWYFVRLINKNQIRLNEMKKEKKRILEEVMDKETYKVAKQILEKFSSENAPKSNLNVQLAPIKQSDDGLRKRIISASSSFPKTQLPSSMVKTFIGSQASRPLISSPPPSRAYPGPITSVLRLPAPILPLQRNYLDRVVEYLIGDGPNNRYALICSQCHSHNGMALKEEFEYIGFKCCYCFFFNPARKVRPEAPKLESPALKKQESSSDSEKTSDENSDAEHKITLGNAAPANLRVSSETSNITHGVESSTNKRNDEASEENESDIIESAENHSEVTEQVQNSAELHNSSNHPESDKSTSCDQSLVKS